VNRESVGGGERCESEGLVMGGCKYCTPGSRGGSSMISFMGGVSR